MAKDVRLRISSATVDKEALVELRKSIEAKSDESVSFKGRTYERRLHFPEKRRRITKNKALVLGQQTTVRRRSPGRYTGVLAVAHDIVKVVLASEGPIITNTAVSTVVGIIIKWAFDHKKKSKRKLVINLYGPDDKIIKTIESKG
jgi:hypothetical protein